MTEAADLPRYSTELLQAVVDAYNANLALFVSIEHLTVSEEALSYGLQDGPHAIVVHLLADGRGDALIVGTPSIEALGRLRELVCVVERTFLSAGHTARATVAAVAALDASRQARERP